jgi:hypothetical protein
MNNYDLIESYLDELIDRIKSIRAYARDEELFGTPIVEIDGVYNSSFDSVYDEIREIMTEVRDEL